MDGEQLELDFCARADDYQLASIRAGEAAEVARGIQMVTRWNIHFRTIDDGAIPFHVGQFVASQREAFDVMLRTTAEVMGDDCPYGKCSVCGSGYVKRKPLLDKCDRCSVMLLDAQVQALQRKARKDGLHERIWDLLDCQMCGEPLSADDLREDEDVHDACGEKLSGPRCSFCGERNTEELGVVTDGYHTGCAREISEAEATERAIEDRRVEIN